ncbi:MAG: (1-_4)-alpha-D-glucan 1-alpha-D-glucosylmutase [Desulforhopalus sp.]|jgi:(1->4)-alpha-D-glucan 1-alpha-D-glucosylmutase
MEKQKGLDLLAQEAGIQLSFHDNRGVFQQVSDDTKTALLVGMGLMTQGVSPESALADLRTQGRHNLLPRVLVFSEEDLVHTISLMLDPEEIGGELNYYLAADQGESFSGHVTADELQPFEQQDGEDQRQQHFHFQLKKKLHQGYHRLILHTAKRESTLRLVVAPSSCYLPERLREKHRLWGSTLNLSLLSSQNNWGIGDFSDLEQYIDLAAEIGSDAVGLSPLHVHGKTAPLLPSTRYFADPIFTDLTRITDYNADCFHDSSFSSLISACQQAEGGDYEMTAKLKHQGFQLLFRDFQKYHLDTGSERASEFQMFKAAGGKRLFHHAVFFALEEYFSLHEPSWRGWHKWPREFQTPSTDEVLRFARQNRSLIDLYNYILWQSEIQLAACGERSLVRHLGIGLCPEITVGADPEGAETWVQQPLYCRTSTIGAPPNEQYPEGLDWGLAPPIPWHLAQSLYEPFVALLRKNMKYAGAVQIDHAMQMIRLFWIPAGGNARDGAYVHYPLRDLLGIVALESQRNKCMIITRERTSMMVDFEQTLRGKNIFPCSFSFSDEKGGFRSPANYPDKTVAMVSPPGHPALSDYWEGRDLDRQRREYDSVSEEKFEEALTQREAEKKRVLAAIEEEDLLPPGTNVETDRNLEITDALNRAFHRYLARTQALLIMVRLEDIFRLGEERPMPSGQKGEEYPYSRFSVTLGDMRSSASLADFAAAVINERLNQPVSHKHRGRQALKATIPRATYRLQLNRDFTFAQASAIVPYLAELGISHCYTSPCFAARAGSTHGYDVVDPNELNKEIGGMDEYLKFNETLKENGMGQIIDIVPNHMGVMGSDNVWWLDVLENGRSSAYAPFFDIDWQPVKVEMREKLLLPVLGEPYGKALEQGNLILTVDTASGSFSICYHGHRFPLDPRTYPLILNRRLDVLDIHMGQDNPFLIELLSLITAFGQLSPPTETDAKKSRIRRRDKEILKERLARLAEKSSEIHEHIQATADEFNNRTADTANLRAFHALLEEQTFRLANWRVAADEINYRRFFDINDLAALSVEKKEVFDATHRLIFDLVRQGMVDGLRVDHPDGLFAPAEYYQRLFTELQPEGVETKEIPVYLVVEKILAHHEHLPEEWLVHGTTGYDFANLVNGLLLDNRSEKLMDQIYRHFTSIADDYDTILYNCKKQIMRQVLASELNVLANRLDRLSERNWQTRDFTLNNLREALSEVTACFPVYRTYVTEKDATPQDRNYIDWAIAEAKRNTPTSDHTIFDFLRAILLLEAETATNHGYRQATVDFAMRFQQFTAPVMAKGMEDTAFYIFNRLVSQNEVGGNPRRFGVSIAAFHQLCRERAERWPHTMLATSTHDSKRSEDARCRINVLSEIPEEWQKHLISWGHLNNCHTQVLDGVRAPSSNDEYLLYQALLAIWPNQEPDDRVLASLRRRMHDYMEKACREAKTHSSWAEPNLNYEEAVFTFIDGLLADGINPFLEDFLPFQRMITLLGLYSGLSQCLLKLSAPGIPDIYQGCELWNFRLVDPDNRQPIDYSLGRTLLAGLNELMTEAGGQYRDLAAQLLATMEDGRIKLYVIWRLLTYRRQNVDIFRYSNYIPLAAEGPKAEHVCGFARRFGKKIIVSVCARFFADLTQRGEVMPCGAVWTDTFIEAPDDSPGCWYNILTGEFFQATTIDKRDVFAMEQLFATLPVAFLEYRQKE